MPATIFEKFQASALKYPKNIALAWKVENKYQTINYRHLLDKVNRAVSGLKKLGVKPDARVAIFSRNRTQWAILDLALNKLGAISVPIHTTLSPGLIKHALTDSGAEFLAIGDFLSKFQEIEKGLNLKKVIAFTRIDWRVDFLDFNELLKEMPDAGEAEKTEICSIIYTSGTTGNPKGVMLSNANFLSNISAATQLVPYGPTDVFLSFLPLSHVLERTGGFYAPLLHGAAIYFAESPKTLSDDIKKARPTILIAVPRVFEKVYDKIMDRARGEAVLKQKLFYWSLHASRLYLNAVKSNLALKFFLRVGRFFADRLVLKKVRAGLGGRLRFAISGGAPLNPSVARFFEALRIIVLEGYGLTETSPIISVNPLADYRFGTVGKIIGGVDVKIAEDKEILVKGPNVMAGYWNNQSATDEAFAPISAGLEAIPSGFAGEPAVVSAPSSAAASLTQQYFKTGDLGFVDKDGYLSIIGRKKEMIVTSNGKNINPETIEAALAQNRYISQAMVYGDKEKRLLALIVPDFGELKVWAEARAFQLENFELISQPSIRELYKNEIEFQLRDFPDNERIGEFKLLDREFSEEKEELTPTLKLRRRKILENFNIA